MPNINPHHAYIALLYRCNPEMLECLVKLTKLHRNAWEFVAERTPSGINTPEALPEENGANDGAPAQSAESQQTAAAQTPVGEGRPLSADAPPSKWPAARRMAKALIEKKRSVVKVRHGTGQQKNSLSVATHRFNGFLMTTLSSATYCSSVNDACRPF